MTPLWERMLRHVVTDEATGCMNWTASTDRAGYGQIRVGGRTRRAHRVSCELAYGPPPMGSNSFTCHRCHNPACVNPDHLYWGDINSNTQDSIDSGRMNNGKRALTHCPQGHPYDAENTYTYGARNYRGCKECRREGVRRYRRNRAQVSA